nr:hypothetical protein [Clostridioides sp.]
MSDLKQINKDAINVLNTETLVDGTFKDIVNSYSLTSEILKLSQKNINDSLIKKGVTTSLDAKLSSVPEKILDLPNMGGALEIVPPNVGAVVDRNDDEFDVTKINMKYSPSGKKFSTDVADTNKVIVYTDNYVVWSVASRDVYFKRFDDVDNTFKKFTIPEYNTNNFCSARDGDRVYSFNKAGPPNVMNIHVYDLTDTDLTYPKETYPINDCYDILWCDTIDGVITLLYKATSFGTLYFGTYVLGEDFITRKTGTDGNILTNLSYDDKYFYLAFDDADVGYVDRAFTFESIKYFSPSGISKCSRITPIGDNLILHNNTYGARLHAGIDSVNPLGYLHTITTRWCNFSVAIDDTHFIASYNSSPYARLHRLVKDASGVYTTELVDSFVDISTSNMNYPGMIIAKDLLGKQYLAFARYWSILIEGINEDYEFELERRN